MMEVFPGSMLRPVSLPSSFTSWFIFFPAFLLGPKSSAVPLRIAGRSKFLLPPPRPADRVMEH
jgi:hypothetical protein